MVNSSAKFFDFASQMANAQNLSVTFLPLFAIMKTDRKYDKTRSYISFCLKRYNGTLESLACLSRKPHSHPNQHTEAELKQTKTHQQDSNL